MVVGDAAAAGDMESGGAVVTANPVMVAAAAAAAAATAKVGSDGGEGVAVADGAGGNGDGGGGKPSLAALFAASAFAAQVEREVGSVKRQGSGVVGGVGGESSRGRSPLLLMKSSSLRIGGDAEAEAKKDRETRVSWLVEISVVSQRMFKDMVRKPGLIVTHMLACLYYGGAS